MANETYCTTWWGDTARNTQMVNGACDLVQCHIELHKTANI